MTQGDNFSVKDLLTEIVIPRLDKIDLKLDGKANAAELRDLEKRVNSLELDSLDTDKVRELIRIALDDAQARGWTNKERWFGVVLFLVTIGSFLLTLFNSMGAK